MSCDIRIGEQTFTNATLQSDADSLTKSVRESLTTNPLTTLLVTGNDPDIYIGGVSRLIAHNIASRLQGIRTTTEDIKATNEVSNNSRIIFQAIG